MSETPEDLETQAKEDKIRAFGLTCTLCAEDIATEADLESYRQNDKKCSRCAHRLEG